MFQPFLSKNEFYPGLILWGLTRSWEVERTIHTPEELMDPKLPHELRPCLVVAVDHATETIQVSRLCATMPIDTRQWIRINSAPALIWKHSDAWMWVGAPLNMKMQLNKPKSMHPHKDTYFSTPPISTQNLEAYWFHRRNFIQNGPAQTAYNPSTQFMAPYYSGGPLPAASGSTPHMYNTSAGPSAYPMPFPGPSASSSNTSSTPYYSTNIRMPPPPGQHLQHQNPSEQMQGGFGYNTLAAQHVVVPVGFTETRTSNPGWFRNPETGWFWHAAHGLVSPEAFRARSTPQGQ